MRKLLCFAALAVFMLPFAGVFESEAQAQKDKAKASGGGTIVVSEGADGKFRFSVRDADGKFLANSGANAYASEKEALKGAEDFKATVAGAKISASKEKPKTKDKKKDKKSEKKDKKTEK